MLRLAALVLMLATVVSVKAALPISAAVPGGVVSIKLSKPLASIPNVSFNKRAVAVVEHNGSWHAVIGLPLSLKPGKHSFNADGEKMPFQVTDKQYPEQRITLKTRKHIDLSASDLDRHRGEKIQARKAFKTFDGKRIPDFAMLKPVDGPYSSPFGLKRFFNNEPRNPHSGLDIAAPTGTPIKAPAGGKVVLTGNFFFNGNVVYVDHGQGVISMFCHLSKIDVADGDLLKKGDILGKVGATGRVTGPHLHWSLSLNNTRIDPMLMLEK
ncbi:MAG: murein DD-endopeptidase MepM/ murein hydrolase activator NlpD [Crocinitomicaceae bacterium]|jgi:murein DD-endopeptidase MepM/ murein hydrolase activator NlpD